MISLSIAKEYKMNPDKIMSRMQQFDRLANDKACTENEVKIAKSEMDKLEPEFIKAFGISYDEHKKRELDGINFFENSAKERNRKEEEKRNAKRQDEYNWHNQYANVTRKSDNFDPFSKRKSPVPEYTNYGAGGAYGAKAFSNEDT